MAIAFKRKDRRGKPKERALALRLGIIAVGVSCFMLFSYMSTNHVLGLVSAPKISTDFINASPDIGMSETAWENGGFTLYARALAEDSTNNTCTDSTIQDEICVGYGGTSFTASNASTPTNVHHHRSPFAFYFSSYFNHNTHHMVTMINCR